MTSIAVTYSPNNRVHLTANDTRDTTCYELGWLEAVRLASAIHAASMACAHASGTDFETFALASETATWAAMNALTSGAISSGSALDQFREEDARTDDD